MTLSQKEEHILERRKSRKKIFQALYMQEMNPSESKTAIDKLLFDEPMESEKEEKFIRAYYEEVLRHASTLDASIQEYLKGWKITRIPAIDRCILRLAFYEIQMEKKTLPKIVINEAIELSKQFGSDESASFINGVLDSLIHSK